MTKHTVRIHVLCSEDSVLDMEEELSKKLGYRFEFVEQEGIPGLWASSGQWTEEEADALLLACKDSPSLVVFRGEAIGVREEAVEIVREGARERDVTEKPKVRFTPEAAKEIWVELKKVPRREL